MAKRTYHQHVKCSYCNGDGYVHLLLGGSETCHACGGTGQKNEDKPLNKID